MPRAELTIDLPEGVWIGDLSRSYPDTSFRILSAFPDEDSGYGLLEISTGNLDEILDRIRTDPAIRSLETVQRVEDRAIELTDGVETAVTAGTAGGETAGTQRSHEADGGDDCAERRQQHREGDAGQHEIGHRRRAGHSCLYRDTHPN